MAPPFVLITGQEQQILSTAGVCSRELRTWDRLSNSGSQGGAGREKQQKDPMRSGVPSLGEVMDTCNIYMN